jgi:hypothetical protein
MKNKIFSVVIAFLAFAVVAQAAISSEKKQEIEKMLKLTGTEKMMGQVPGQMIDAFKTALPDAPATFWQQFAAKANIRELIDEIIPIYDKYYTLEDLRAVNAFYSTPAGQKIIATLPQVMQESMQIGQRWGEKLGAQAVRELQSQQSR